MLLAEVSLTLDFVSLKYVSMNDVMLVTMLVIASLFMSHGYRMQY